MENPPILRLKNITKRFGKFEAIKSINLDIEEGEFLTIVGPSGSGKTTLIRLLVGMDEPTEGEIWLRDKRIEKISAEHRPTCMVFQSLALFPHRSVGENIEFPLKIRGVDKAKRQERAYELLELLRLPRDYYDKQITQCSGGERQRVALARALAFDPEILFFDEPLSALDYRLRKTLEKELKDLHKRTGKTFVYITHSLEEAMVMSDRIAIMRSGVFEQIATAEEIYSHPVNRFVASFMGEVNLFEVEGTQNGRLHGNGVEVHVNGKAEDFDITLKVGEKGALMVRPENMRFQQAGVTGDFQVRGIVRARYILGSRVQFEVEAADGSTLTLEQIGEDNKVVSIGEDVILSWDIETTHLIRGV